MKLCGKDFNEFRMYMYNKKAFISRCCMFTVIQLGLLFILKIILASCQDKISGIRKLMISDLAWIASLFFTK